VLEYTAGGHAEVLLGKRHPISRQAARLERFTPSGQTCLDMLVGLRAPQERDPLVSEPDEVLHREADSAIVLGLEPPKRRVPGGTAGDHDWDGRLRQQRKARIVELWIGEQEAVHAAGGG